MRKFPLISKEVTMVFRNKTALIYFFLLFAIISYSFYSAVDLYSKASVAAIGNPLYAAGFEPAPGIFVPTFGGLFIIFSLIAPFLLIRSFGDEKRFNTLPMLLQLPYSVRSLFLTKLFSATLLILVSILLFAPVIFFWHFLGGHIPRGELILLMSGYFLYGLFIVSVSFFSSSLFGSASGSSVFSLAIIMFSWFVDFGKEMNIIPFLNKLSDFTTTKQLKIFEEGILSLQAIVYYLLLSIFFLLLSYYFFDPNIKNKRRSVLMTFIAFILLFGSVANIGYKSDVSESGKNSFSSAEVEFLKKLPSVNIEIFLEPTDGRFKDYENDFLKKLKMVKSDISVSFSKGKKLKEKYGLFKYKLNNKTDETYSNSAYEIFMVLEDLSGLKIEKRENGEKFRGFPLVVEKKWSGFLFILYLILFPLLIIFLYNRKSIFLNGRKK